MNRGSAGYGIAFLLLALAIAAFAGLAVLGAMLATGAFADGDVLLGICLIPLVLGGMLVAMILGDPQDGPRK